MAHAVPDVLTNWIGTYVLPAVPPPTSEARLTDRSAVLHAARPPVAVLDFGAGVAAGELAGGAPPVLALLAGVDGAADDADEPLPEDPQPAASAAAATSVTPPSPARSARKRTVIIPIPFVLALACSAQT
jgi:hypothetical protein